jgi:hypothetical protein
MLPEGRKLELKTSTRLQEKTTNLSEKISQEILEGKIKGSYYRRSIRLAISV